MNTRNRVRKAALACFFVTGATGLMYEVTWNRMLGFVFGNTVFATATVLTSFMAGLALGSYLAGRYADRISNPLRFYALMAMGVGIYCFFIPRLIELIARIYLPLQRSLQLSFYSFSLLRFILCFCLLLIPATLMGATTPIFARFYVERGEGFGHGVGRAYSVNTFGAFAGVLLSGFLMMERLGVRNTVNAAAAGNVAAAIVCLLMGTRRASPARVSEQQEKPSGLSGVRRTALAALMVGFGVSGFAALTYEVAWTRILSTIIGSSVYAFSIMLATFLLGLALGSLLFSVIAKKRSINLLWFGAAELIIGLAAILMLPVFGKMPFYFVSIFEWFGGNYAAMELSKFLLCLLVMIAPTILLGSLFPMVTQIFTRDYSELGRRVGIAYSVNTLGNIGGSFASGFVLIPQIGTQNTIILAAALNIIVGCGVFLASQSLRPKIRAALAIASVVLGVLCVFAVPSWNKMVMSSGPSVYAKNYAYFEDNERNQAISGFDEELLYYREGLEATIAVRRRPLTGAVVMAVNGKVDASSTGDMYTQLMVGHIPLMLSANPETAMVVGLGSGVTLAAASQHPLKQIDCVEIEPAVVEASKFFRAENRDVLDDPRVKLIENDARNYLAVSQQKYDVIISQPSNLWVAGMANLFSLEFYQLCRERLVPGGILCQWSHTYHLSPENLKIVVNTFKSVFPYTSLWYTVPGDIMMIGSAEEVKFDYLQLAENYNFHSVRADLQSLDIKEPLALLSCYILDSDGVGRLVAGSHVNTDDHPVLEFSAPRSLYQDTTAANHKMLLSFRTGEFPEMENLDQQQITDRASFWYYLGTAYDFKGMADEARRSYEKAISIDESFAPAYAGLALNLRWEGKTTDAVKNLKKAIEIDPSEAESYYNLAQVYHSQGLRDEAVSNYEYAIRLSPQPWKYHQKLADLFMEYGEYWGAIREYDSALRGDFNKPEILYSMAKAYNAMGMINAATARLREAIAVNPSFTPPDRELGDLFNSLNQPEN